MLEKIFMTSFGALLYFLCCLLLLLFKNSLFKVIKTVNNFNYYYYYISTKTKIKIIIESSSLLLLSVFVFILLLYSVFSSFCVLFFFGKPSMTFLLIYLKLLFPLLFPLFLLCCNSADSRYLLQLM